MSRPQDNTVYDPAPSLVRFALWFALLIAAIALIYFNYALVVGPFSELTNGEIAGIGIDVVATVVLIVLEVLLGAFFLETAGVTALNPVIHALPTNARRRLGLFCMFQMLVFGGVQAGLVWMAGGHVERTTGIPLYGPMIHIPIIVHVGLAFVLPFLQMMAPLSADRIVRILRGR